MEARKEEDEGYREHDKRFYSERSGGKGAFDALKSVCMRVMSSPSLENLAELRGKMSGLPAAVHPHLVDYVLLPVRVLFKRCGR